MDPTLRRLLPFMLTAFPPLVHAESLDRPREDFHQLNFGMSIHFNLGTLHEEQWVDPGRDRASFDPARLDCGQWADAAKGVGMKCAVPTAKHQAVKGAPYKHIGSLQPDILTTDDDPLRRKFPPAEVHQVVDSPHRGEPMGEWAPQGTTCAPRHGPITQSAWFWKPAFPKDPLMSVENIGGRHLDVLEEQRCNLLLDCTPDREALMDEDVVRRLAELGKAPKVQP